MQMFYTVQMMQLNHPEFGDRLSNVEICKTLEEALKIKADAMKRSLKLDNVDRAYGFEDDSKQGGIYFKDGSYSYFQVGTSILIDEKNS